MGQKTTQTWVKKRGYASTNGVLPTIGLPFMAKVTFMETFPLAARLNTLEEQKASLACELAEETKGLPALSEMDIVHWLGTFAEKGQRQDHEYASSIIDMLINSVTVYKNPNRDDFRLLIAYNLTGVSEEVAAGSDLQCMVTHRRLELRTP